MSKKSDASETKTPPTTQTVAQAARAHAARSRGGSVASPEVSVARIPVTDVQPVVDGGMYPAKAVVGEDIPVEAVAFREGHDALGVAVVVYDPRGELVQWVRMRPGAPGTDRWHATIRPANIGVHHFTIESWSDPYLSWWQAASVKIQAGVDLDLMIAEGAALFRSAAEDTTFSPHARETFREIAQILGDDEISVNDKMRAAHSDDLAQVLAAEPIKEAADTTGMYPLDVQRELAFRGSWYEFFPRSEGAVQHEDGSWTSGTFRTAAERLPAVAEMGFNVVYLPPIHPIGVTHRKGPNNTLEAGPNDPGSPWAIGAAEGGHEAIHPDLGDFSDFAHFVSRAESLGLEIALDLALQCSPDHHWVTEHPEWFTQRVDGSIAYAENPPKKYQDIYPLNFDQDPEGLSAAVLEVVEGWIGRGVKIFRVDNPHTKPLWFWQWLIATVRAKHPEVVFLAEAFTRPAMMHSLAKVGFQQSYSYFTWRNTAEEIREYLHEVSAQSQAFYRPNFFVNTPDILTEYLVRGGRPAFKVRAALAATSSPLWGVYSGFELYENVQRPGSEEYIDNEKYEYRPRDYAGAEESGDSLAPYLRQLNAIRKANPALGDLANLTLHESNHPDIVVYSATRARAPEGWHRNAGQITDPDVGNGDRDTIIVVLNTNPERTAEATVNLNLPALGLHPNVPFDVEDLITGSQWEWGPANYVRLDPHIEPVHVLRVRHTASPTL